MEKNIRPLSKELQEKAIIELNEDPKHIEEFLLKVREWLEKQPHLRVKMKNQDLITFLRGTKWSFQVATQKIDNFYSIRSLIPEFYEFRDPLSKDIQSIFNSRSVGVLPHKQGSVEPTIIIGQFTEEFFKTPTVSIIKGLFMIIDFLMQNDDNSVISGFKLICDFKNITTSFMLQLTPTLVKNFVVCMQNVYPIRLKALIAVHVPRTLEIIYDTFAKPFLTEKLKQRFHLTSKSTWTNRDNIDTDITGLLKSIDDKISVELLSDQLKQKIEGYRDWFLESNKYFSDEDLRPSKLRTELGEEGSFRRLDID